MSASWRDALWPLCLTLLGLIISMTMRKKPSLAMIRRLRGEQVMFRAKDK